MSLCFWFQCTYRVLITAVWFVCVFVISVYRQSHEDCCQHHPCVCDFSVIQTEPWGRLSSSSLCLWFQCYTDRAIRLLSSSYLCLWFQCKDRAMRTAVSFILVGLLLQLCLHSGLGQVFSSNKRLTHSKQQQQQNFTTPSALISKGGGGGNKKTKQFTVLKVVAMPFSLVL